jgi:hypothetical protein
MRDFTQSIEDYSKKDYIHPYQLFVKHSELASRDGPSTHLLCPWWPTGWMPFMRKHRAKGVWKSTDSAEKGPKIPDFAE